MLFGGGFDGHFCSTGKASVTVQAVREPLHLAEIHTRHFLVIREMRDLENHRGYLRVWGLDVPV